MKNIERVNVKSLSAKANQCLMIIGAARARTKRKNASWLEVENETARVARLVEKKWLETKSLLDLNEFTIHYVAGNYKYLLNTSEDYVLPEIEEIKTHNDDFVLAI